MGMSVQVCIKGKICTAREMYLGKENRLREKCFMDNMIKRNIFYG